MFKKFLLGASVLSVMSISASAADVGDVIEPIADSSWTGAYIGLVGGYGWGDADVNGDALLVTIGPPLTLTPVDDFEGSIDVDGYHLGGKVGFDVDAGNGFVLGLVGDMSWTDMEGDICIDGRVGPGGCAAPAADTSFAETDINWLATVRARAGFAMDDLLVYATGGLAIADVDATVTHIEGLGDNRSDSNTHYGWVAGAGAEFRVMENVTIGAEYLYVDLGDENYNFLGDGTDQSVDVFSEADITAHIVRGSLNFRF